MSKHVPSAPLTSTSTRLCHVLVVDDHPDSRRLMTRQLGQLGFDVTQVDNAEEGLAQIDAWDRQTPLPGVVLDLQMAIADNHRILHRLCARAERIPVIVVSTLEDLSHAREAIRRGAQDYLVKPFDQELFRQKCLRVFARQDRQEDVRRQEP